MKGQIAGTLGPRNSAIPQHLELIATKKMALLANLVTNRTQVRKIRYIRWLVLD